VGTAHANLLIVNLSMLYLPEYTQNNPTTQKVRRPNLTDLVCAPSMRFNYLLRLKNLYYWFASEQVSEYILTIIGRCVSTLLD
jgi:hypothetical protein